MGYDCFNSHTMFGVLLSMHAWVMTVSTHIPCLVFCYPCMRGLRLFQFIYHVWCFVIHACVGSDCFNPHTMFGVLLSMHALVMTVSIHTPCLEFCYPCMRWL